MSAATALAVHNESLAKVQAGRAHLNSRLRALGLESFASKLIDVGVDFFEDLQNEDLLTDRDLISVNIPH